MVPPAFPVKRMGLGIGRNGRKARGSDVNIFHYLDSATMRRIFLFFGFIGKMGGKVRGGDENIF